MAQMGEVSLQGSRPGSARPKELQESCFCQRETLRKKKKRETNSEKLLKLWASVQCIWHINKVDWSSYELAKHSLSNNSFFPLTVWLCLIGQKMIMSVQHKELSFGTQSALLNKFLQCNRVIFNLATTFFKLFGPLPQFITVIWSQLLYNCILHV